MMHFKQLGLVLGASLWTLMQGCNSSTSAEVADSGTAASTTTATVSSVGSVSSTAIASSSTTATVVEAATVTAAETATASATATATVSSTATASSAATATVTAVTTTGTATAPATASSAATATATTTTSLTAPATATATVTSGMASPPVAPTVSDLTPPTPPTYRWSGSIAYTDVGYSETELNSNRTNKPLRGVKLELLDANNQILATTTSSTTGTFTLQLPTMTSATAIRLTAEAATQGYQLQLQNSSGQSPLTALHELAADQQVGSDNLTLVMNSRELAGGMNVLDVLYSAMEFLAVQRADQAALPPLTIFWQPGWSYGTYFCDEYDPVDCLNGVGIYIGDSAADSDSYDDDVIWHEFGHYIEWALGIADSPGGSHYFTDTALDLRLAWSEGFASFVMAAIKNWVAVAQPSQLSTAAGVSSTNYIDTNSSGGWAFDFLAPDSTLCFGVDDCYLYASNEVAVSQILWQIHQNYGVKALWPVIDQQLPAAKQAGEWINLNSFWNGLTAQLGTEAQTDLAAIFADRQVWMVEDSREPDGDRVMSAVAIDCTLTLGICLNQQHTLFGRNDVDVVAVDLSSRYRYTIETEELRNGADTYLTLYNSSGLLLLEDDDNSNLSFYTTPLDSVNDGENLRSRLSFTPPQSDRYFIEVTRSPEQATQAPFAGEYGSYGLKVTAY